MVSVDLKPLIGKLNSTCRRTLEGAAGLCLSRTNYNVEVEHWLLKLLDAADTDLMAALRQFEIDPARLTADLTRSVDRFQTGNSRPPVLSPNVVDLAREAWVFASIDYGATVARSGHLLCALVCDDALSRLMKTVSREFEKIQPEVLRRDLRMIMANTGEADSTPSVPAPAGGGANAPATGSSGSVNLDKYTVNLTEQARSGKLDPVVGRDAEIRQVIDILTRRRQNNPILTGEAGVGKTAVVEGFALRIAEGDVPDRLQNVELHTLDLGLLQAGAGMKGEFEARLKGVIDEVKASPKPIILFIDEAHTMIGAGGQAGQGDAANLLKPALARGELRTIAATTWAEYKKFFEKDAALTRRFQVVKVEEPEEMAAINMMQGLVASLEKHHGVTILSEAVVDAVKLSKRYISGRQLPDKSVSLLDTACARVALSMTTTPPPIEDCHRRIQQAEVLITALEREKATGSDNAEDLAKLHAQRDAAAADLEKFETQWAQERRLTEELRNFTSQLLDPASEDEEPLTDAHREVLVAERRATEEKLREVQGESPLMHPCVDSQAIAETVSNWTGIPVGRMVANEIQTVLQLQERMEEQIVGQSQALEVIAQSIRTSRANLGDPRAPVGVFLLAGTSGVGKTETAITLANLLYGGEQNMTTINMSEFKEEHKVSLLMGSPPGYVGYGEGGVLTEAVRRKPYSVILLDEMEKAHPGVQDIFYQVFDKGQMKDGEGRDINFRNTLIIMTTNAGTDRIMQMCTQPQGPPGPEAFAEAVFDELLKTFKPAFLGRLCVTPYYPLDSDVMKRIIRLKLDKIGRRITDNYKAAFSYTDELVDGVCDRCTEVDTGARNVDHILSKTLLPELSSSFLARMAEGKTIGRVHVGLGEQGDFQYEIE
ncbi:type VI secretion system ATPase TssH [Lignipirellula cremea]|uniref:Chaperone protein ClpB n=1 Tax=Lignipirellula cremea TaxID=2528010 RepID=A0A518E1E1_9BACT|nr:type VI secretion system ATPase TssH [Lignipirellula cremea]QDU97884.1 Chaperone protein ClpB [Lignipirellula cremea]